MDNKYLERQRQYDLRLRREVKKLKDYALSNVGVVITLFYFVTSLAGLFYLKLLLRQFDVNVFQHIELSDYLLALLSNGQIMAMFSVYALVLIIGTRLLYKSESKQIKDTFINRVIAFLSVPINMIPPVLGIAIGSVFTLLFYSYVIVDREVEALKEGKASSYDITLNYPVELSEGEHMRLRDVAIVTSTAANLFIYKKETQELVIIPHANVAGLVPKLKVKEQKKLTVKQEPKQRASESTE